MRRMGLEVGHIFLMDLGEFGLGTILRDLAEVCGMSLLVDLQHYKGPKSIMDNLDVNEHRCVAPRDICIHHTRGDVAKIRTSHDDILHSGEAHSHFIRKDNFGRDPRWQ